MLSLPAAKAQTVKAPAAAAAAAVLLSPLLRHMRPCEERARVDHRLLSFDA